MGFFGVGLGCLGFLAFFSVSRFSCTTCMLSVSCCHSTRGPSIDATVFSGLTSANQLSQSQRSTKSALTNMSNGVLLPALNVLHILLDVNTTACLLYVLHNRYSVAVSHRGSTSDNLVIHLLYGRSPNLRLSLRIDLMFLLSGSRRKSQASALASLADLLTLAPISSNSLLVMGVFCRVTNFLLSTHSLPDVIFFKLTTSFLFK